MHLQRHSTEATWLLFLALTCACSAAPTAKSDTDSSSVKSSGGSGNTGSGGTATNAGTSGTSQAINTDITLTDVTARVVGRLGADVQVEVAADGDPKTVASVQVTLKDADDNSITFFDTNWDHAEDSATGRLLPFDYPTKNPIAVTVLVPGAGLLNNLDRVTVALVDKNDSITVGMDSSVSPLPKVGLGKACDPAGLENRCQEGLKCNSDSKVCVTGTAPTITKAVYTRNAEGPILRVAGEDPDEDVLLMRMNFVSALNGPVYIDMDGDDIADANTFETSFGMKATTGGFTFDNQSGLSFDELVPKLELYVTDSLGNESPKFTAIIADPAIRTNGQSCDFSGLQSCGESTVCIPRATGTLGTCTVLATAQTARCDVAQTIELTNGTAKVSGIISGTDVWAAPSTCVIPTLQTRPDAVYKLHLANSASELTLSTAQPETTVDTVLTLLPKCTALADTAFGCNDDTDGFASELTLKNVRAGDYVIVVESRTSAGGPFGLKITAK